jgi:hypothetical protein
VFSEAKQPEIEHCPEPHHIILFVEMHFLYPSRFISYNPFIYLLCVIFAIPQFNLLYFLNTSSVPWVPNFLCPFLRHHPLVVRDRVSHLYKATGKITVLRDLVRRLQKPSELVYTCVREIHGLPCSIVVLIFFGVFTPSLWRKYRDNTFVSAKHRHYRSLLNSFHLKHVSTIILLSALRVVLNLKTKTNGKLQYLSWMVGCISRM